MADEIAECPRVAHDAAGMTPAFHRLAADFRQTPPPLVVLCGRGSSGHAALFLRYLIETRLLTPVSLAAPSVASAYKSRMRLAGAWFVLLSQSGESPDLIEAARAAKAAGALTIGFVNAPDSTLGNVVDIAVPLRAGPETSIAATKSVLATMAAGARLVAEISADLELHAALDRLPLRLERALACDWTPLSQALLEARDVYVIGRGLGLGLAKEVALKLAEVARAPAHAYSAVEILHGPRAAIREDSPSWLSRSTTRPRRPSGRQWRVWPRAARARFHAAGAISTGSRPIIPRPTRWRWPRLRGVASRRTRKDWDTIPTSRRFSAR